MCPFGLARVGTKGYIFDWVSKAGEKALKTVMTREKIYARNQAVTVFYGSGRQQIL